MTQAAVRPATVDVQASSPDRRGPSRTAVLRRRVVGLLIVAIPLLWALRRATPDGTDLLNRGGLAVIGDLLGSALHPSLDPAFLLVVLHDVGVTVTYAVLGAAGALVIGVSGGLVLSEVAWPRLPPPVRLMRTVLRTLLVAVRSIHELVWALLFVSVLGLDPLVAVLSIALPFGAQTAQVFAETFDGVPRGPLDALRWAGARPASALAYGLFPTAGPLLLSYSFYRLECSLRSSLLLGVVGVGGLGQELVVSLSSRNWDEVWTLVAAVVVLSAVADLWSTKVRGSLTVASCSDWSGGVQRGEGATSRGSWFVRASALLVLPAVSLAWFVSGVSWSGLTSERTHSLTVRLVHDMWPPQLPRGGLFELVGSALDTLAMAVLAMAVAVVLTVVLAPAAVARRDRSRPVTERSGVRSGLGRRGAIAVTAARVGRWVPGIVSRLVLLVLRSVPATVWAVVALLALFPGILPGALALGLYTGGILGRLAAEAWEGVDRRPSQALEDAGMRRWRAVALAVVPPSINQLITYTLYRFEICVRETAVVGIVGAAGLGRLLTENLAVFRFPVVTALLATSFVVSSLSELVSRRLRTALRS